MVIKKNKFTKKRHKIKRNQPPGVLKKAVSFRFRRNPLGNLNLVNILTILTTLIFFLLVAQSLIDTESQAKSEVLGDSTVRPYTNFRVSSSSQSSEHKLRPLPKSQIPSQILEQSFNDLNSAPSKNNNLETVGNNSQQLETNPSQPANQDTTVQIDKKTQAQNLSESSSQVELGIVIHTVQSGDTLYNLSKKYNSTLDNIAIANNLEPPYILKVGDKLKIPIK